MKNLKEFLRASSEASHSQELAFKNASTEIAASALSIGLVSAESKADKFAEEVTKLASSDEVISKLSNDVGVPFPNESEDEFVSRAKKSFKKILMTKLAGK
ncbi:hypothetical protein DLR66_18155 [Vibrio paracholerae]|uniref:hypothetical protein n=1 Tax=Vibrio TaxID=662 RepID=UPI000DE46B2F|nr:MULTISPECIES: hypothetical protein [Vibrio]RBM37935.1 hypothetical protein DLR66_18155 [Vibrio paracholerae]SUP04974.1 Uncharacterised protein [Vibrio cincinnatiensis]SUP05668.1 Uncharacterised protein [Vibrio cincinnatiensis]SUP05815.1 Uncharacterised protein [Vibrio cincinnatiensis]